MTTRCVFRFRIPRGRNVAASGTVSIIFSWTGKPSSANSPKTPFLEHAQVYGHYYGTSREWVRQQRERGLDVILEIDWQGAEQVRKLEPAACSIFILPPSVETLRERLRARGLDDEETIARRMRKARQEIAQGEKADFQVVNDEFNQALAKVHEIIRRRRRDAVAAGN